MLVTVKLLYSFTLKIHHSYQSRQPSLLVSNEITRFITKFSLQAIYIVHCNVHYSVFNKVNVQ